jgi:hypothetical protein
MSYSLPVGRDEAARKLPVPGGCNVSTTTSLRETLSRSIPIDMDQTLTIRSC